MLLSNAFRPDPRVRKEALALLERGCRVTIIPWDRQSELAAEEIDQGIHIIRVQGLPGAYGAGVRQLLTLPRYWKAATALGQEIHPQVVHCHDLDTLPAGWRLKERLAVPLVYDAHEDYPALMSLYLSPAMVTGLRLLETWLIRSVDVTLTASTLLAEKFRQLGIEPVIDIPNVHELAPFEAITPEQIENARQELGLPPDKLVVAYIGGFSRNRALLPLIEAGKDLPEVEILLWGDGHQRQDVIRAVQYAPNIHYMGWLAADQVPLTTSLADVIYYCLNTDYPGAIYNAPNTLANAMAAGRPILANRVGDLGRIVETTGCGLLLDTVESETVRQAILKLADPRLRASLGAAGKQAAQETYNWSAVKEYLWQIYRETIFKNQQN